MLLEIEHGEVTLKLLAGMLRVQLSQLPQYHPPGLDLLRSVLYPRYRLPPGWRTKDLCSVGHGVPLKQMHAFLHNLCSATLATPGIAGHMQTWHWLPVVGAVQCRRTCVVLHLMVSGKLRYADSPLFICFVTKPLKQCDAVD